MNKFRVTFCGITIKHQKTNWHKITMVRYLNNFIYGMVQDLMIQKWFIIVKMASILNMQTMDACGGGQYILQWMPLTHVVVTHTLFQTDISCLMEVFCQMGQRWYYLLKLKLGKNLQVRLIAASKIHLMDMIQSREILGVQMFSWFIQEPIKDVIPCF